MAAHIRGQSPRRRWSSLRTRVKVSMGATLAIDGYMVKPPMARGNWDASRMGLANNSKPVLAANLSALLETRSDVSRLELSKRMGVADGTLGRIKYGTGNPTVEVLDQIAGFFNIRTWQLLKPGDEATADNIRALAQIATPRSRAALEAIQQAADRGQLTDDDLRLLHAIAERFMGR